MQGKPESSKIALPLTSMLLCKGFLGRCSIRKQCREVRGKSGHGGDNEREKCLRERLKARHKFCASRPGTPSTGHISIITLEIPKYLLAHFLP
jgi:hypothetical protein